MGGRKGQAAEGCRGRGQGQDQGARHQECLSGACSLPASQGRRKFLAHYRQAWAGCIRPISLGYSGGPLAFFADIDECADADACGEARCKNLPGSYSCLCDEGYEFSSQDKACRGTLPQPLQALPTHTHLHRTHA